MTEERNMEDWNITDERFIVFLDIMGFKDFVARKSHKEVYDMMVRLSGSKSYIYRAFTKVVYLNIKTKNCIRLAFLIQLFCFQKIKVQNH